ncbi:MAG TPA: MBOAT family O-acyltransferase [Trichormus sp.]|jgi:alginate O-acetyltransferase complex protein AlgI
MTFTSIDFAILTAIAFALYYLPGARRFQLPMLVLASFIFYSWSQPTLLLLLGGSIAVNTSLSWMIYRCKQGRLRILWAALGIIFNVLLLGGYKLAGPLGHVIWKIHLTSDQHLIDYLATLQVPIGLSFYTFEGISLLVDSLSESQVSERETFLSFMKRACLFFSFFPHLMAGPILRPKQFFPQIAVKHFRAIDWEKAIKCLAVGYFLKCFVADNIASLCANIFAQPECCSSWQIIGGICVTIVRIFGDFAGYSLIAIGLGVLFGYTLPQNFNFPLRSQSFSEFWRRWHITLSTWLRDYIYIPLGGSRRGKIRTLINLGLVMTVCGFWHGTKANFVIWGLLNGLFLGAESLFNLNKPRSKNPFIIAFRVISTYLLITSLAVLLVCPLNHFPLMATGLLHNFARHESPRVLVLLPLFAVPVIVWHVYDLLRERMPRILLTLPNLPLGSQRAVLADAVIAALLFLTVLNFGDKASFVYFQF